MCVYVCVSLRTRGCDHLVAVLTPFAIFCHLCVCVLGGCYLEKVVIIVHPIWLELSQETGMNSDDVISTLQYYSLLKYWKGNHIILKRKVSHMTGHMIT